MISQPVSAPIADPLPSAPADGPPSPTPEAAPLARRTGRDEAPPAPAPPRPEVSAAAPRDEDDTLVDSSQARPAAAADASGSLLGTQPTLVLTTREVWASLGVMLAWLVLLTAGIAIGVQPYIDAIQQVKPLTAFQLVGSAMIVLLCHTVPNIAILCCLSAFLGVIASRAIGRSEPGARPSQDRMSVYVAAVTRGFFVFLVIQSGSILLSDTAFTNLTLERYIRLAGLSSLFSFAIGYNPQLFTHLMLRVNQVVDQDGQGRPNS